jgi:hypothetical protein
VKLPEGVRTVIQGRDFTVATIAGAAAMKPEVEEGAAGAPVAEGAAEGAEAAAAPAADAKAPAGAKGAATPAAKEAAKPEGKGADRGKK